MNDKELLGFAAKAAGISIKLFNSNGHAVIHEQQGGPESWIVSIWNPLVDDGQALRLMAELKLSVNSNSASVGAGGYTADRVGVFVQENIGQLGSVEAHRRAIVRAAAEIGRGIE